MKHDSEDDPRSFERALAEPSPLVAFVFERRWLPSGAGLRRVACTNVPHVVAGGGAAPFDWGNHSPGAYELALNALEVALEHLRHRGPRTAADGRVCFLAARLLQRPLVEEMIADANDEGTAIPMVEMERWLTSEMDKMDSVVRQMLAPRYQLQPAAQPGVWSAGEVEAILGGPVTETPEGLLDAFGSLVATPVRPHPLDSADWELPPL
ncbi:MAG TPA: hypothetical protein VFE05_05165 [Longimicrobiaceae bacterium]|jgi:hypothetical protein|nr:hypothetical protein [Longimicrobiaceae bacterium]